MAMATWQDAVSQQETNLKLSSEIILRYVLFISVNNIYILYVMNLAVFNFFFFLLAVF